MTPSAAGSRTRRLALAGLLSLGPVLGVLAGPAAQPRRPALPAGPGLVPAAHPLPLPLPLPPRSYEDAYVLLLHDRLLDARDFARRTLDMRPEDPRALVLMSVVRMHLLDLEEARKLLNRARRIQPDLVEIQLRIGDLEMANGNFKAAENAYRSGLSRAPADSLLRLNLSATLLQDQRRTDAEKEFLQALRNPELGREATITRCLVQFLLGHPEAARITLESYETRWGPTASTRFITAMVHLRAMDLDRTRELLGEAARRSATNPSMLEQIANLYLALGMAGQAHELLAAAVRTFPGSKKLKDQFQQVEARALSERQLEERTSPPFRVHYDVKLERSLVDRVVRASHVHLKALGETLGAPPEVIELKIFSNTGFASPAYYNNLTGAIIVSGPFFREAEEISRSFVDHALRHELAHLMLWCHRQGSTRSVNSLWLDEGLAEYLAGGIGYLRELKTDLDGLFQDGPLSMSDLIGNINVLWGGRPKNMKAYVQSYFMTAYLMDRGRGRGEPLALATELLVRLSGDVPLERALADLYGLTLGEFEKGWQMHLERELAR